MVQGVSLSRRRSWVRIPSGLLGQCSRGDAVSRLRPGALSFRGSRCYGGAKISTAVIRSIVGAGLILLLAVFFGISFLYAYRAQTPGSQVTGDATPLIAVAPAAILFAILPLAVLFLVVYAAVRLAVRHERKRGPSELG